jgi:beta-barrel assembly-enhancing protease
MASFIGLDMAGPSTAITPDGRHVGRCPPGSFGRGFAPQGIYCATQSTGDRSLMRLRLCALSLALSLVGCAPSNPTKPADRPSPVPADKTPAALASQQLADAQQLIAAKNWPEALAALQEIVDAKSFSTLDSDIQYQVLMISGRTALDHGSPALAFGYLVRVTSMRQATDDDWYARLRAADKLEDKVATVSALTVFVQRWPVRARELNDDYILRMLKVAEELRNGAALPLLQSLYDAHWKQKWDIEPSSSWRDLVLGLLEKGQLSRANAVAAHVTDPYVLIAMRADRRFDALVAVNPSQFEIAAASHRELASLQAASDAAPRSLELKWRVIKALLNRQHYDAALAASDAVLSDIRSTNFPERLYGDFADQQSTFFAYRAIALERLQRWDEAIAQMSAASLLPEKYGGNVDQIIDLGMLYCDLGRPGDGLSTIAKLTAKTSAFGDMHLEYVRLGNSEQATRSLAYMHAHRDDAPISYKYALLIANHLDQAATELIKELLAKDERQDALLSVQIFAPTPDTPRNLELEARRRAVIDRPDVQAAIEKVGRVDSYRLEEE